MDMRKLEKPKNSSRKKEVIIGRMRQKGGGYHCLHENKYRMKLSFQIHSSSRGMGIIFVSKLDSDLDFCVRLSIVPVRSHFVSSAHQTTLDNGMHQPRKCRVDQYLPEIAPTRVAHPAQPGYPTMMRYPYFLELQFAFIMSYNL